MVDSRNIFGLKLFPFARYVRHTNHIYPHLKPRASLQRLIGHADSFRSIPANNNHVAGNVPNLKKKSARTWHNYIRGITETQETLDTFLRKWHRILLPLVLPLCCCCCCCCFLKPLYPDRPEPRVHQKKSPSVNCCSRISVKK